MLRTIIASCALLCVFTVNAEARQRHRVIIAHESCNGTYPNAPRCEGVVSSPRGEYIARSGFGTAQKVYRVAKADYRHVIRSRPARKIAPIKVVSYRRAEPRQRVAAVSPAIVAHPSGCPSRAFCGCGAAVEVFGAPVRSLWLAANWFKFPRAAPAAGMVAVRRHHVFVLRSHLGGDSWIAYDANSGGHATRIHARSIAGYTIVNPHGSG